MFLQYDPATVLPDIRLGKLDTRPYKSFAHKYLTEVLFIIDKSWKRPSHLSTDK